MAKTSKRVAAARPNKYKTREYSRCRRCGRPRAVYRKFGICRICLRELAHNGFIPRMTKSRWEHSKSTQPHVHDRPHRRLPRADPQRDPRRARDGGHPVVQAQARDGADPQGAGLHRVLRHRAARRGPARRAHPRAPEVHRRPPLGDLGAAARVAPGPAPLRELDRHPQGPGRHGDVDRVHVARRDDGPRGAPGRRRRRSRRGGVVMSRIGKKPIAVPATVTVTIEPEVVRVAGPGGTLEERKNRDITVEQNDGELLVKRPTDRGEHRALHGLTRSLIANMVEGVTTGFQKTLEIQGVGYRATLKGRDLEMALGYSHPVPIKAPEGITFEVPQPTRVIVKGIDKQLVGEIAAYIRKQRPPEPYKGKGIRYEGEYVARKVGKRA